MTAWRVAGATPGLPLRTRLTVASLTPACAAMSARRMLTRSNLPSSMVAGAAVPRLGPKGYGAVQVAPPEDSLTRDGHPWWEVYQPADYNLTSRMGDRAQFTSMVSACHAAGVKVYADAVINHMTGQGSTSYGGVSFS